jgi:ATP-dependent exoDNAse (exonuclease V) beta subunit|tara:strand:+ start:188 stop:979 length:792 start_codon:yes stop_codon:yes gene_type:complete
MSAEQYDYLQKKNPHERDNHIVFDEPTHVYTVDGDSDYMSVTTFNHGNFEQFDADKIITGMMKSKKWSENKYYGKTRDEIKNLWDINRITASEAGTAMHLDIEKFYNNVHVNNDSIEYKYFMNFWNIYKHTLIPWRTEMMVWDKDYKLAGSVDMIFEDKETGELCIYDWKRCKEIKKINSFGKYGNKTCIEHLPDTNYWHYCLQLNTYKYLIEKNYQRKVKEMYLVCLHPDNKNKNYLRIKVVDLNKEINDLLEIRKHYLNIN